MARTKADRCTEANKMCCHHKIKKIIKRDDCGQYIEILGCNFKITHPIKKNIVGPQKDKIKLESKVRRSIDNNRIAMHCSETPISRF